MRRWRDGGTQGKKPEPADYMSCIEEPLIWSQEQILTLATTPLHFMLGIGLELFNKVEFDLKKSDYAHTKRVGRIPEEEELAVKVRAANAKLMEIRTKLQDVENDVNSADQSSVISLG